MGCGNCTLCCTIMRVEMEPVKEARQPCRHCAGRSCAIYEARPEPCRIWSCVWLLSQEKPDLVRLPAALRPDRSGVVLEVNSKGNVIAHSERPASWKREPMRSWLTSIAGRTRVVIENGESVVLLMPDGSTRALVREGYDSANNESLYRLDLAEPSSASRASGARPGTSLLKMKD